MRDGFSHHLDNYRSWLFALAMLASRGDRAAAAALFDHWCLRHGVGDEPAPTENAT